MVFLGCCDDGRGFHVHGSIGGGGGGGGGSSGRGVLVTAPSILRNGGWCIINVCMAIHVGFGCYSYYSCSYSSNDGYRIR